MGLVVAVIRLITFNYNFLDLLSGLLSVNYGSRCFLEL